jgi:uncharacterized glyoxalase superfamily protein PhnB
MWIGGYPGPERAMKTSFDPSGDHCGQSRLSSLRYVRVDDVNAHCARARAHGARILMEPTDFEYGERQYTAADLAGHQWTFTETLDDVDPATWGGILRE